MKPAVVPEGLGLVAQKDLGRNEVVLEVPKRLWINPDAVAASEIGSVCSGLKPWLSVALFLIREKKKNDSSSWRYYLDVLPEYTNSTIFWSVWLSFDCFFGFCFLFFVFNCFIIVDSKYSTNLLSKLYNLTCEVEPITVIAIVELLL